MNLNIDFGSIIQRFSASGIKILIIVGAVIAAQMFLRRIVPKLLEFGEKRIGEKEVEFSKRMATLGSVIANAVAVILYMMAGLMILSELGIDIVPLLTGAGLLGLAFGFGAQNTVRDLIAGFFILMENQYRKGDVIKVAGTSGLVEDINLRRTILRDLDGVVHFIPNGEITSTSNLTLRYSRVNLNIPVSYETNLDKAIKVLNRIGKKIANDKKFGEMIVKAPEVWGVEDFAESSIEIKFVGETKPIKQWDVARELRKRIKIAFDREKIEIPYPHRVIVQH
ncbi:hypothetical protein A3G14_00455 [Candidatus Curtissbacteria bacterium RIFCSPLOWO2_12_FULL_38_9]|uniref:Potassium transporter KefA n=2 Tax=Candidatus Curtissiibacteriota TaxID=1752717 RepID=A0A1F5G8I7_9BACT|nr:MAG: hypothetical protein A3D04_01545 [Candidatus Curtissbacteria bacterium RIFCSPHIGHO2_02_FULL_40_16b]OGE13231.1 MAG: hypothetical protein A3G14_00455 [Candidatus Curtissbacteria bacterium RIFCSPLOWO2_12_FULL_38_9]